MLKPILDPLDRPAGDTRRDAHQDHVGKDALLDPVAATGRRRRSEPNPVTGDLQRTGHHRVDRKRPLEIGQNVVGVLARLVAGDDTVGLDGRAGIAGIGNVDADPVRRRCEGTFRIAVGKTALVDEI